MAEYWGAKISERMPNLRGKIPDGKRLGRRRGFRCGKNEGEKGFGENGEWEIDRGTMEGFGIPQQDYKLHQGKVIFSHKSENWQCMICGKTRPTYEWAQIIGHVAATHRYKSRGET